jgi:anti-anti-sigma factor
MSMSIQVEKQEAQSHIKLNGRFDFASHRSFKQAYEGPLKEDAVQAVVVDMGNVNYVDSSALGMLLVLRDRATQAGKKVSLANCQGTVAEVLKVANFGKLFEIA